jgi:hypothetical protein
VDTFLLEQIILLLVRLVRVLIVIGPAAPMLLLQPLVFPDIISTILQLLPAEPAQPLEHKLQRAPTLPIISAVVITPIFCLIMSVLAV